LEKIKPDSHEHNFNLLNERVGLLIQDQKIQSASEAPIFLLLKYRFYAEDDAILESHTDGGNDIGVDAVFIERNREQPIIHISQSKFHESLRKSRASFKASSLEKIVRFFGILKDSSLDLTKLVNHRLEQKIYK
jgi:hypothetical protein